MSKRKGPPTDKPHKNMEWNVERGESMDRALLMGSILFRLENYKPIMMALHDYRFSDDATLKETAANDFKVACENAGLENAEMNWLWNYLKNYTLDYNAVSWASPGDGW